MSLYRKVRPDSLKGIIGNKALISSIEGIFSKDVHTHSFLLTGPSGCGKTTIARIIAEMVGANSLGFREINCSDNNGVADARQIVEDIKYLPQDGNPVIFFIDEVHRATKDWQNVMLKPLEDTPPHVYFLLSTTEPNSLLKAVLTRTTELKVESQTSQAIYRLLSKTARAEEITTDPDILHKIAENCEGSPRKALVILEQVAGMEDLEEISSIIKASGESEEAELRALCQALLKDSSWKVVKEILKGLKGQDPEGLRRGILGYMNSVLLNSGNSRAAEILEEFWEPTYNTGFPGICLPSYLLSTK